MLKYAKTPLEIHNPTLAHRQPSYEVPIKTCPSLFRIVSARRNICIFCVGPPVWFITQPQPTPFNVRHLMYTLGLYRVVNALMHWREEEVLIDMQMCVHSIVAIFEKCSAHDNIGWVEKVDVERSEDCFYLTKILSGTLCLSWFFVIDPCAKVWSEIKWTKIIQFVVGSPLVE